jgi:hypothetical protein
LLGTFILPLGNFSILVDLPDMYSHCKTFEDKDLTPIDFITDHLICLDSLIDSHANGDEQKPHQPLPKIANSIQQPLFLNFISVESRYNINDIVVNYGYIEQKHPQSFFKPIFHPPVV